MFEHISPEEAKVDSRGIIRFLDDMREKRLHMHALMILRHGKVITEASFAPWSKDSKHILFSLSKSFTSTAVGFAVQDGLIKTSDRLIDFFPELLSNPPCENMRKITVKHMLTMNTGHKVEATRQDDCWEQAFLHSYIEYEPGTHFMYNTFATYMLSAIVQKVTGRKLLDYLREKLFEPLEMSDDIWTEESPTGIATGGYGLNVRVEDIAKLGQFYLQEGKWNGKQLLGPEWIRDARTPWSDNSPTGGDSDWGMGYGYQFWMCKPDNVFRGDGAFGQYCVVCPDQDMVIAINSGVKDMGAVLNSIWENILPAVDREADPSADLSARLKDTATPAMWEDDPEDVAAPAPDKAWLGKYRLSKDNIFGADTLEVNENSVCLIIGGSRNEIPLCKDAWQSTRFEIGEGYTARYSSRPAVRAARTDNELLIHICYTGTPFEDTLRIRFADHGIEINGNRNVGFGNAGGYEIIGYRL